MRSILPMLLALTFACGGSETESAEAESDTTTTGDEGAEPTGDLAELTDEGTEPEATASAGCQSSDDCAEGEMCTGGEGCDEPWTCEPVRGCTRDLVVYCSCSGETVQGSGSCPPEPYAHRGPCE